jgi:hypothetical protein
MSDARVENLLQALRGDGMRIGIQHYANIRAIHVLQTVWSRSELRYALQACLVRDPRDIERFGRIFDEVFGSGGPEDPIFPPAAAEPITPVVFKPDKRIEPPPVKNGPEQLSWFAAFLKRINAPNQPIYRIILKSRCVRDWIWARRFPILSVVGAIVIMALGTALFIHGNEIICGQIAGACARSKFMSDLLAFWLGLFVAVVIVIVVGLFTDAWLRVRTHFGLNSQKQMTQSPWPVAADTSDGGQAVADITQFRLGDIGWAGTNGDGTRETRLPSLIQPWRGRQIAEMLNYADAGTDLHRYDLRATINHRARHPEQMELVPAQLRALPQVTLLVDTASGGPLWNSIAVEVASLFTQRGLLVTTVDFAGTFHRRGVASRSQTLPEYRALFMDIEDAAPSLTLLFTDGARLTTIDAAALRRLRVRGPLLWLDYRDQHLWDGRHVIAHLAGATVWEATANGLEMAVRSVFLAGLRNRRGSDPPVLERMPALPQRQALRTLDEAADWAADCALLQPISVGLADRLRSELHPYLSWIAFSRLLALPETMLTAEGLRFGPDIAAFLQQRFVLQRSSEAQQSVTRLLLQAVDDARPKAHPRSYAAAAWGLTRARIELFADPDRALPALARIRDAKLVDPELVTRLFKRIRVDARSVSPPNHRLGMALLLPHVPVSLEARALLRGVRGPSAGTEDALAEPAVLWRVSSPLYRNAIDPDITASGVAFSSSGEQLAHLVTDQGRTAISIIFLATGRQHTVELPEAQPVMIAGASGGQCFVVAAANGVLYRIDSSPGVTALPPPTPIGGIET